MRWDQEYQSYEYNSCCSTYKCGDNNQDTCCDDCWECNTYPETFYKVGISGRSYEISKYEYLRLKNKFDTGEKYMGYYTNVQFSGDYCGYNGKRFIVKWDGDPNKSENAVSTHKYINKVRHSNSLYKPHKISKDEIKRYKLLNYPNVSNHYQNDLVGYDNLRVSQKLAYFNGLYGKTKQIKVFVFVLNNNDKNVLFLQKNYLENGNKNEFNILVRMNKNELEDIDFATWCEVPSLTNSIKEYFYLNKDTLSVEELVDYSLNQLKDKWVRTEFTAMNDLVHIKIPLWYWAVMLIINVGLSILLSYIFIINEDH